jgi:anion-transporting  ArsA/GET3 family ATPase
MSVLDVLEQRKLIVVTGKGGVGKSTLTAVIGRQMASRGRRALLVEVDPRESLHHLLDVQPSGGEVVEAAPRLWLQHIEPRRLLDDLVREKLKVGMLVRRVLASPVHHHFTEGAPGLKETAVFGRILRLLQGHVPRGMKRPDVVVLDAPATGHGVSWLAAPRLISDVIQSGPVGHMASEIADFMDDRSAFGVVAVTLAEEMPVQECIELIQSLERRLARKPDLVVVNALYPPIDAVDAADDVVNELWRSRRAINDRELDRMTEAWSGPTVELPLLPVDPGPRLVGVLARRIESTVVAP